VAKFIELITHHKQADFDLQLAIQFERDFLISEILGNGGGMAKIQEVLQMSDENLIKRLKQKDPR
jgi:hypothetical protein